MKIKLINMINDVNDDVNQLMMSPVGASFDEIALTEIKQAIKTTINENKNNTAGEDEPSGEC